MDEPISNKLEKHYSETFQKYGATPAGVDWGIKAEKISKRYRAFISHLPHEEGISILDVGCGYGEFTQYLDQSFYNYAYTGIDPSSSMIDYANENMLGGGQKTFQNNTLFDYAKINPKPFDCVVCCGLFTQKLDVSNLEMFEFFKKSLACLFSLAKKRVVFNVMSFHANFYAANLFYLSPAELCAYIMGNVSRKMVLDCASLDYECVVAIDR